MKRGSTPVSRRTAGDSRRGDPPTPTAHIYISDPHDWALVLKSGEVKCVVQALDILYDKILEIDTLGQELVDKGIVEDILSLPKNSYPYYNGVRYRFLSKLLTILPEVKKRLTGNQEFTLMAMDDALRTDDTPLRAYGLQYVAYMTQEDPQLLKLILENFAMNKVASNFLIDPDVDVQHNALALLINILKNEGTNNILEDFRLEPLCSQVACPYPDIQNKALDVLEILTSFEGSKRSTNQEAFIHVGGIHLILTVLFIFHWRDLHPKCLKIFLNLVEDSKHLISFDAVHGIHKLVEYLSFIEDEDLIGRDLDVLLKISTFEEGKLVLIRNGAIPALIRILEKRKENSLKASEIIKLVSEDSTSIPDLSSHNPIPLLIDMILDNENSAEMRCTNATTVNTLVKNVPVCTLSFSEKNNFIRLQDLLNKPFSLEEECLTQVLEAMSTVLSYPTHLKKLINRKFTENLLTLLLNPNGKVPVLHTYGAELLSWTLYRENGRELFIALGGVNAVMKILYRSKNNLLLDKLGLLLKVAFSDQILTECFIRAGIDSWLLVSQELWKDCENLAEATKFLLEQNLTLKFEYYSRLEIWDRITDGFYVCRSLERNSDFPLIKDLLYEKVSPLRPIFYINTGKKVSSNTDLQSILDMDNDFLEEKEEMPIVGYQASALVVAKQCHDSMLRVDQQLIKMIDDVEQEIKAIPAVKKMDRLDGEWIKKCAKIIGKRVAEAMSGKSGKGECNNHVLELHISQLKYDLETSLIPIGFLNVGLKLERAVLFKTLADRVNVPCALVRGEYATGWIELPIVDPQDRGIYAGLPDQKLITNYLVDLMEEPGKIVHLESEFAREYCGFPKKSIVGRFPRKLKPGRNFNECEPSPRNSKDSAGD